MIQQYSFKPNFISKFFRWNRKFDKITFTNAKSNS